MKATDFLIEKGIPKELYQGVKLNGHTIVSLLNEFCQGGGVYEPKKAKPNPEYNEIAGSVINYLNSFTGKNFRHNKSNFSLIFNLLKAGYTESEIKEVIYKKTKEWINDTEFNKYLCPSTLFRPSNFEKYLNQHTFTKEEAKRFENEVKAKEMLTKWVS